MVSKKGKYTSGKLAKRKKQILIWKISLISVFVVVLLIGVSFWSKHSSMQITNIEIEGLTYSKTEILENDIREYLQGNYVFLFSRSNSLIYPRDLIRNNLIEKYSFIESINLDFVNFKTIKVKVKEFKPHAKWCREIGDGKEECFLMNENGYVFVKEPLINGDHFVKFTGAIEGAPLKEIYVSVDAYKDLHEFIKLLRRLEIDVKEVITNNSQTFDVITESNTKIIVDIRDDMSLVFDNLKTVIEKDALNKAQFGNIEYIDLRFGNRVFYKLK